MVYFRYYLWTTYYGNGRNSTQIPIYPSYQYVYTIFQSIILYFLPRIFPSSCSNLGLLHTIHHGTFLGLYPVFSLLFLGSHVVLFLPHPDVSMAVTHVVQSVPSFLPGKPVPSSALALSVIHPDLCMAYSFLLL